MPIRPVGRPRKGALQMYKDGEMGFQRSNLYPASQKNVFDLEQNELPEISRQSVRHYPYDFSSLPPNQETEKLSMPKVIGKGLINTKGMFFNKHQVHYSKLMQNKSCPDSRTV